MPTSPTLASCASSTNGVNQDDKHVFEGERWGADQAPQSLGDK